MEILSRFSQDTEVALVYFYPKHELREEFQRAGIRLFFLDIPETYHFGKAVLRLVKLIRKEKPDLLISCLWRADMITRMASWITGVPLVGTLVNDSYSPIAWKDKKGLKYKIVYGLDRWTSKIPVHWIANAQALVDSHIKTLGLDPEKISVVYRGRSVPEGNVIAREERPACPELDSGKQSSNEFKGFKEEIASATKSLSENSSLQESSLAMTRNSPTRSVSPQSEITASSPQSVSSQTGIPIRNFISYGRLLERKGFQDAINAFAKVLSSYRDCTLTIFGDGPYRKELEKLVQVLELQNSVFLPGKISNPMEVLLNGYFLPERDNQLPTTDNRQPTTAHCFLFPSWYEGFSGALVEAMMARMPIIASDISMNLEAVEKEKTALIYPATNPDELAQKMLWAIQNPTQMIVMGEKARELAIRKFDIEKIAKEYEQVLLSILPKLKNR